MALSPAAAGLLRSLLGRAGIDRDRILLTEFRSVDWQSLTFIGERHEFRLKVPGPGATAVLSHILSGLDEAELDVPGHLVADIAVGEEPQREPDGSISVVLEALTIAKD